MTAAFPSWITPPAMQDGFSETPATNRADFQPEVGEPIRRRRTTLKQSLIPLKDWYSTTAWDDIDFFFRTTLAEGSLPFTMNHPRTAVTATWMFVEPPKISQVFGSNFQVMFSLRLLSGGVILAALKFNRPRNSQYSGAI